MASTNCGIAALTGLATPITPAIAKNRGHVPISFLSFPQISRSNLACKSSRLRIWQRRIPSQHLLGVPIVSCLVGDNSSIYSESGEASIQSHSSEAAAIDIKLPRRSLLVKFTCNACGVRSEKLINRVAYERGTVFVQCAGCFQHHKLVDNLGLVVEYDFREEIDADSNANRC